MAHWMCTTCGYYLQSSEPLGRCPGCEQICVFNDVTCYRPGCGGEHNIDPLMVGSTLRILKEIPKSSGKPEPPLPSSKAIPLHAILGGLSKEQRQQLKSLGRIEHDEPDVVICTEGTEARNERGSKLQGEYHVSYPILGELKFDAHASMGNPPPFFNLDQERPQKKRYHCGPSFGVD